MYCIVSRVGGRSQEGGNIFLGWRMEFVGIKRRLKIRDEQVTEVFYFRWVEENLYVESICILFFVWNFGRKLFYNVFYRGYVQVEISFEMSFFFNFLKFMRGVGEILIVLQVFLCRCGDVEELGGRGLGRTKRLQDESCQFQFQCWKLVRIVVVYIRQLYQYNQVNI